MLKSGGRLVMVEGWGNNPLLDAARRLRWRFGREPVEAGEGVIFNEGRRRAAAAAHAPG